MKLVPLCNQWLHVMLYQMKLNKLSLKRGFYLSSSVLPLLGPEKQSNLCKTKPKHKIVPHPLPSDLNTICEYRF